MKTNRAITNHVDESEASYLADFIMFSQRNLILKLSPELAQGKVSFPQFFLLAYLTEEESISITSIARMMGHSTAAATGMVDKLEEMGYVERITATADRRKTLVRITQSGIALVERMRSSIARDLAQLLRDEDVHATSLSSKVGRLVMQERRDRTRV